MREELGGVGIRDIGFELFKEGCLFSLEHYPGKAGIGDAGTKISTPFTFPGIWVNPPLASGLPRRIQGG